MSRERIVAAGPWLGLSLLLAISLTLGSVAGEAYGNGLCQSCNLAKKKAPCPTGAACVAFATPCPFAGLCTAPALATGTCVWGPVFSSCWTVPCPLGTCPGGLVRCQCANPGNGC